MDFFHLSKLFWLLFVPGNFLAFTLLVGVALLAAGRRRWGMALVAVPSVFFAVLVFLPLDQWVMRPLENRFPRPAWPAHVQGIVVLGAGEEPEISASRGMPTVNFAEGALVEAASLMRRYPGARLIFSGGSPALAGPAHPEAMVAHGIFDQLGAEQSRIIYEDRSRNTWENLVFSRRLAKPAPGETWLLVTSAIHMPRSMGIAGKIGWTMTPWPTDYQTLGGADIISRWNMSENLGLLEEALREWIGLGAYWLTGKTSTFFPAPAVANR